MTVDDLLTKARSQVGSDIAYALGGGKVVGPSPEDENGSCDCAAFVDWCLGLPKWSSLAWLKHVNGGWWNTDGIWWDALIEPTGMFREVKTRVGAIIVYPSRWLLRSPETQRKMLQSRNVDIARAYGDPAHTPVVGHVGLVSSVSPIEVVHCSAGNARKFGGKAIQETDAAVFQTVPSTVYTWCDLVEAP